MRASLLVLLLGLSACIDKVEGDCGGAPCVPAADSAADVVAETAPDALGEAPIFDDGPIDGAPDVEPDAAPEATPDVADAPEAPATCDPDPGLLAKCSAAGATFGSAFPASCKTGRKKNGEGYMTSCSSQTSGADSFFCCDETCTSDAALVAQCPTGWTAAYRESCDYREGGKNMVGCITKTTGGGERIYCCGS